MSLKEGDTVVWTPSVVPYTGTVTDFRDPEDGGETRAYVEWDNENFIDAWIRPSELEAHE